MILNLKSLAKMIFKTCRASCYPFVKFLDSTLIVVASKSKMLAGCYYFFLSRDFLQEQQAFLTGRVRYTGFLKTPKQSMALLRRNTHRIEKGLLMKPRRTPFALDYIEETVDAYCTAIQSQSVDPVELKWSHDVLDLYFQVCRSEIVSVYKERFLRCNSAFIEPDENECRLVPYQRDPGDKPDVSIDSLLELAKYRRSVRWFLPKSIPRQIIDAAVLVAGYSPSACNRQPYQFRIIDDLELVKKISSIPMGTAGYAANIPCIVVVIGAQRNYFHERDRHLIYIDGSLAAMSFILALESQGVSSCCINWPEIHKKDRQMAEALDLSPDERPVMCIAIGYPDHDSLVARSVKKSLEIIRRYNFE